jgi:hypothetical protein
MAWRIVKQPNGLYARFSDVVDDFTDYDMSLSEAKTLCMMDFDMSDADASEKVWSADVNKDRFDESIATISSVHGHDKAMEAKELMQGEKAADMSVYLFRINDRPFGFRVVACVAKSIDKAKESIAERYQCQFANPVRGDFAVYCGDCEAKSGKMVYMIYEE